MKILMLRSAAFNTPRLSNQAKLLSNNGHKVHILYWERDIIKKENLAHGEQLLKDYGITSSGIETKLAPYGKGITNIKQRLAYTIKIIKFLHKNSFDAVHAVDFDSCLPVYLYNLRNRKVKFVYDIADFIQTFDSKIPKPIRFSISYIEKRILKKANTIILPDENRLQLLNEEFHSKAVIVNNSPLFNENLLHKYEVASSKPNNLKLAYYGGFSEERGIQFLLEAVPLFKDSIDFHFAGWGQLINKIQSISKQNRNIYYHGKLTNLETLSFVREMDLIYIFYDPRYEHNRVASPNKLFEAFYLAKPVIVANNTSIDEIVKKYEIGYTGDYDKKALFKILRKLEIERLNIMGQNSKNLIEKYGYKIAEKNLISIYARLD